jgi:hypothetical protein
MAMDNQLFEQLEQKILQVLAVAARFKTENRELMQKNQELLSKLEEKERILLAVKEESERRKSAQTEMETYKEKQDRIRFKIENLLEKLKEFEEIP